MIFTQKVFDSLRVHNLKQIILTPTCLTGFNRTCIDSIVTNVPSIDIQSCGSLADVISDHFPVFVCVKKQRNRIVFQKTKGRTRTYNNYDKKTSQTLVKNENWNSYYDHTETSELWEYILTILKKHIDVMCPIKYMRVRVNSPPWITQDIIEAINDRNLLFKQAKISENLNDLRLARVARNRVNKLLQSSKADCIKETLKTHEDNPKKF